MNAKPTLEFGPKRPRPAKGESSTLRMIDGHIYRAGARCWILVMDKDAPAQLVIDAARLVVTRWEHGDLAGAVRELDSALHVHDAKEYKP